MTLNELEQRITALKSEQDKLTAELEKLKAEQAEVKPWRAENNGKFYFIDCYGEVFKINDDANISGWKVHSIGNYYRTKELAEQDAKELALRGRIRQLRDALCEGYQFINYVSNWIICFDTEDEKFYADERILCNYVGVICFDTREHAQTACDILNAERNKEDNHDD